MTVKLLTEQHLEFLSLKGVYFYPCQMTHCRKSHVMAHAFYVMVQGDTFYMLGNLACFLSSADFFSFFSLKVMTEKKVECRHKAT